MLKLPYYNSYYTSSYCTENKNADICKKWVNTKVDETTVTVDDEETK